MDLTTTVQEFITTGHRTVIPHLSVDCAVFGFDGASLCVLLQRLRGVDRWMLPGGHVRWDESLDAAAARVLQERTGLERLYLQQFYAFGAPDRGEAVVRTALAALGVDVPPGHWIAERNVTVGYLALVHFADAQPSLGALAEEWRWCAAHERPPMALDHNAIVHRAVETLRAEARAYQLGRHLMPEKFTMAELQRLYEAVLGRPLDRRNFRKKILELGVVETLAERKTGRPHRASTVYRFL